MNPGYDASASSTAAAVNGLPTTPACSSLTTHRSRTEAPSSVSESGPGIRPIDHATDAASIRPSSWVRSHAAFSSMSSPVSTNSIWLRKPPSSLTHTFSCGGGAMPRTPETPHPVSAIVAELDRGQVDRHVGAEVEPRLHLVHQLRGHRVDRDQPAGAVVLGDHAAAVGRDLRDREAERLRVPREVEEAREVAAGRLGAALDDVARDHGTGQLVVLLGRPAVPPDRRPHDDRRVGDPTGHHDVRARLERPGDAERAEIGVGREGSSEPEVRRTRRQVVAVDPRDLRRESLLARRPRAASRPGRPG